MFPKEQDLMKEWYKVLQNVTLGSSVKSIEVIIENIKAILPFPRESFSL